MSIVSTQSVVGSNPDESVRVLRDFIDSVAWQPVAGGDMSAAQNKVISTGLDANGEKSQ
jgi:hypothetical protein